jgi:hypothetical protein
LRILLRGEFSGVCSISLKAVNVRLTINASLLNVFCRIFFKMTTSIQSLNYLLLCNTKVHHIWQKILPLDHTLSKLNQSTQILFLPDRIQITLPSMLLSPKQYLHFEFFWLQVYPCA